MTKPNSALKKEAHIILWDFEIQMNHQIPARKLNLELINKEK